MSTQDRRWWLEANVELYRTHNLDSCFTQPAAVLVAAAAAPAEPVPRCLRFIAASATAAIPKVIGITTGDKAACVPKHVVMHTPSAALQASAAAGATGDATIVPAISPAAV